MESKNKTVPLLTIMKDLVRLRDKIAGCGNGRVMVDKYIQDLQQDYNVTNDELYE